VGIAFQINFDKHTLFVPESSISISDW